MPSLQFLSDILVPTFLFFYYLIRGIIFAVIPNKFMRKDVTGQIVLITGGGGGLGRQIAVQFARHGCRIVLWDISKIGIDKTANELHKYGTKVHSYICDVSRRDEVYQVAAKVKKEVGCVDILVNNAGIVTGKPFLQSPDHLIQKTMEVNAMAHFWTVKAFLPGMLDRGHVVSVASSAGMIGVNGMADYCASKFASVGFDECLKNEIDTLGKSGVHTTIVCPYFIKTGLFDGFKTRYPRLVPDLEPEYVAETTVDAVLANQEVLILPRRLAIVFYFKSFLPTKCIILMNRFLGNNNGMDMFRGRQNKTD